MARLRNYQSSGLVIDLGPDQQNLVPVAEDVAIHRGRLVAETLFHIAATRSLQTTASLGATAPVQCVAARVQTSSAGHGQQAAHLLPGQILVAGKPVWLLAVTQDRALQGEVNRLAQQLQQCFAWTNVLPAIFNQADSAAEGSGTPGPAEKLKPLFGSVVRDLWRGARVEKARPLVIDRSAVLGSLQVWFRQISEVYTRAAVRKAELQRRDEARILITYADSFRVANPARFSLAHLPQIHQRYRFLPESR